MLVMLSILVLPHVIAWVKYIRWQHKLRLKHHENAFNDLYEEVNGFIISKKARSNQDSLDYVYGEINFLSFIALLCLVNPCEDTIFYDLGSGTGKAVLACAMVFGVKQSIGVELFTALHQAALVQRERLKKRPEYHARAARVRLINQNFIDVDFSNATLIFINATSFIGPVWQQLSQRLSMVKENTIVITTSKPLDTSRFCLLYKNPIQMSWGIVQAYIYRKIN